MPLRTCCCKWDGLVIGAALMHALILGARPPFWIVGLLFWWNANALAHPFLHRPFFERAQANRAWALLHSMILGVPIELWQQRHFAHHAQRRAQLKWNRSLLWQCVLVLGLWLTLAWSLPHWFWMGWLPGIAAGLLLCAWHGYYEHAGGVTNWRSTLGNWVFFNDGFHAEHHRDPRAHWSELPRLAIVDARSSRLPAAFRWLALEGCVARMLDALERFALWLPGLRTWLVEVHERAIRQATSALVPPHRVAIVGGGLFPRTAIAAARIWPTAALHIIDCEPEHLSTARTWLPRGVQMICARYDPTQHRDYDLVLLPLALREAKARFYREPPARVLLVHDWIWRRRGRGVVIAWLLLKRLNVLVAPDGPEPATEVKR